MTDWSMLKQISLLGSAAVSQRFALFSPLPPIENEHDYYQAYSIRERLGLMVHSTPSLSKLVNQIEVAQNAFLRGFLIEDPTLRLLARFVLSRTRFAQQSPAAAYHELLRHNLLRRDEEGRPFLIGLERNRYNPGHKKQALELPFPHELDELDPQILPNLPILEGFWEPVRIEQPRRQGIGLGLLRNHEKPTVLAWLEVHPTPHQATASA
jgi:hypothetical protein